MRTIIAGSRTVTQLAIVEQAIVDSGFLITTVISGGARGVDSLGEQWAQLEEIPIETYRADWNRYGKSAGPIRNEWMATKADALIAIWDGKSPGTRSMIDIARQHGLKVHIKIIE